MLFLGNPLASVQSKIEKHNNQTALWPSHCNFPLFHIVQKFATQSHIVFTQELLVHENDTHKSDEVCPAG